MKTLQLQKERSRRTGKSNYEKDKNYWENSLLIIAIFFFDRAVFMGFT